MHEVAQELQEILEDGAAIFFTSDDDQGVAVWLGDHDEIRIVFWSYVDDEGVWTRNPIGLGEIVIPIEEEDPYTSALSEILETVPDFNLDDIEELDPECLGQTDLEEDCFLD